MGLKLNEATKERIVENDIRLKWEKVAQVLLVVKDLICFSGSSSKLLQ